MSVHFAVTDIASKFKILAIFCIKLENIGLNYWTVKIFFGLGSLALSKGWRNYSNLFSVFILSNFMFWQFWAHLNTSCIFVYETLQERVSMHLVQCHIGNFEFTEGCKNKNHNMATIYLSNSKFTYDIKSKCILRSQSWWSLHPYSLYPNI